MASLETWFKNRLWWLFQAKRLGTVIGISAGEEYPKPTSTNMALVAALLFCLPLSGAWMAVSLMKYPLPMPTAARTLFLIFLSIILLGCVYMVLIGVVVLMRFLLEWLLDGEHLRRALLSVGILMFVMSYFVQLAATLITPG